MYMPNWLRRYKLRKAKEKRPHEETEIDIDENHAKY
jgi:hypothetical protein